MKESINHGKIAMPSASRHFPLAKLGTAEVHRKSRLDDRLKLTVRFQSKHVREGCIPKGPLALVAFVYRERSEKVAHLEQCTGGYRYHLI